MTTVQAEKIARRKLSLLQLAQELGSVSKACRINGAPGVAMWEVGLRPFTGRGGPSVRTRPSSWERRSGGGAACVGDGARVCVSR